MTFSTAGNYWTFGSWPYFVTMQNQRHFICRGSSGQRLIVRLTPDAHLIPEEEVDSRYLEAEEILAALNFLSEDRSRLLEPRSENQATWNLDKKLNRCLTLLTAYRPVECIELLRKLECREAGGGHSNCRALGYDVKVMKSTRPRIQALLKRLGAQISGLPAYDFKEEDSLLELSRERGNVHTLTVGQTAREALRLVGSPDFVDPKSGRERRDRSETWEYDEFAGEHWTTVQIAWDLNNKPPTISSIAPAKIDWERREERMSKFDVH